jgi:hypothetical protein
MIRLERRVCHRLSSQVILNDAKWVEDATRHANVTGWSDLNEVGGGKGRRYPEGKYGRSVEIVYCQGVCG